MGWQDNFEPVVEDEAQSSSGHWTDNFEPEDGSGADQAAHQIGEPDASKPLSGATTRAIHFSRHLAFGLGDKITAAEQAIGDVLHDKTGKATFGDAYNRNLAFNDKLLEIADKAHPVEKWEGNIGGFAGNLAALAAMAPARAALTAKGFLQAPEAAPVVGNLAKLWAATKTGSKLGSIFGAAGGFGSGRRQGALGALADTGTGAVAGGVLGGVLSPVGELAGIGLSRNAASEAAPLTSAKGLPIGSTAIKDIVPTPEAQLLQSRGVPLTLGQMRPGSVVSKLEESTERVPFLGPAVKAQRDAAEEDARHVILNDIRPTPGALAPGDISEKLEGIYKDFGTAYDEIRDEPVQALGKVGENALTPIDKALQAAANDPSIYATDAERSAAAKWLANQSTPEQLGLKAAKPGESPPLVKAGALLKLRSNIREEIRAAVRAQDDIKAKLMRRAEDALTGGLEEQLPERAQQLLRHTDAKYADFKTLEDAIYRAGDREGSFTWPQFSTSVRNASDRGDYARGGGSNLREFARAGYRTFVNTTPKTGFGETLGTVAAAGPGALIYRANASPAAQTAFLMAARKAAQAGFPLPELTEPEVSAGLARYLGLTTGLQPSQNLSDLAGFVPASQSSNQR